MEEETKKQEGEVLTTKKPDTPIKENKNLKMFAFGIGGFLLLVVLCVVAMGTYRVYRKTATDNFTYITAKALRLPAFKLGEKRVLYTAYVDDVLALQNLRDYEKKNPSTANSQYGSLTDAQISEQVIMRLVDNVLVSISAKTYDLTVTKEETDSAKTALLQNFTDIAEAEKEIKARYGWDLDTYTKKVIYPYNLKGKLNSKIVSDTVMQKDVLVKAEEVLVKIKGGEDFAKMAKQYGSDGTKDLGGDLGWFSKGEMVKEFEDAVFALEKGELNQKLVQTQYGYHIIKVTDMRTSTVKDADGKDTAVAEVMASHILFPSLTINTYLDKLIRQAEFHLYLQVDNPIKKFLESTSTTPASN